MARTKQLIPSLICVLGLTILPGAIAHANDRMAGGSSDRTASAPRHNYSYNDTLPERDRVRLAMKNAEIQRQQRQYEAGEAEIEPPIIGKWEVGHRLSSFGLVEVEHLTQK